jgi:hypothetical protein
MRNGRPASSIICIALLLACAGPAAAQEIAYDDALLGAWQDWSWGGVTRNFDNASPVHGGTKSIAVTYTGGWSGLQLGNWQRVDASGYDTLRFWVHGGSSGGQTIQVEVGDNFTGAAVSQSVTPSAGTWTKIDVPLAGLGSPRWVTHVQWFNDTPDAQPIFYVDDVVVLNAGSPTPTPVPPGGGPALSVDAAASRHPISPHVYGLNFADPSLAAELSLPVNRWGGNATTRYNWQNDTSNRASDWFFENIPNDNSNPAALPDGSASDVFVEQNRAAGTETLLTIPLIGWTPKSRAVACGFSVAKYGAQQSTDPWNADCGNGVRTNGSEITGNDPLDTSSAITPAFVQAWMSHLIGRYGAANAGGVRFYNLDNEPMLWNDTHRDVHPQPASYDELRNRTYAYAAAIKSTDPNAMTLGPALWGWTAYFWSALDWEPGGAWWNNPQDRLAHGNTPFVAWYLQQMQAYEQQNGVRILDYLDLHYYPQASGVALSGAGSASTQALRLRSTRSLWDPSYTDESWINEPVNLIPRMRNWVSSNYPGTKLAIGEYNWGALNHINGALAQADVLGIFGREQLDLATLWDPPAPGEPGAYAFRMYLSYDGDGSRFGDVSVSASSADQDSLSIYAAERTVDGALTLMIINKSTQGLTSSVALSGFTPASTASVYRYSSANLGSIAQAADQTVTPTGFSATFPASSITLVVVPAASSATCGDGVVQGAEQCDAGANNGTGSSCCDAACHFKPNGSASCDGNDCTRPDTCTNGVCTSGSCASGSACSICGGTCSASGGCQCLF